MHICVGISIRMLMVTFFTALSEGCTISKLDLAFVLDDSSSVKDPEFNDVVDFVTHMISGFPDVSSSGTSVGVVMFNSDARIAIAFNRYDNKEQLISAVRGLRRSKGKTEIKKALEKSLELYTGEYGSRAKATRILVLMTDGKDANSVKSAAFHLRQNNVRVFVVGVGESVSDKQLLQVAGSANNYFKVKTFGDLVSVTTKIIPASCRQR